MQFCKILYHWIQPNVAVEIPVYPIEWMVIMSAVLLIHVERE